MVKKSKKRKKRGAKSASGGYDQKSRKKYDRGKRVEAYTMGEAAGSRQWP